MPVHDCTICGSLFHDGVGDEVEAKEKEAEAEAEVEAETEAERLKHPRSVVWPHLCPACLGADAAPAAVPGYILTPRGAVDVTSVADMLSVAAEIDNGPAAVWLLQLVCRRLGLLNDETDDAGTDN